MSKQVDFRTFTLDDVVEILNDTGYETTKRELAFARDNDLFKYVGCKGGNARYLIAYQDGPNEDAPYFVSMVFITIHDSGKLVADYGGCPEFENKDEQAVIDYVNARHN